MLIIKKYHDYYDSSIGFGGIDKTCVYERVPELKPIGDKFEGEQEGRSREPYSYNDWQYRHHSSDQPKDHPCFIMPFVIGFCGKTYVGYVFRWGTLGRINRQEIVYNVDDFNRYKQFDVTKKYGVGKRNQKIVESYYNKFHDKPNPELFFQYHTPIFVADFGTNLHDYQMIEQSKDFNQYKPHLLINPMLRVYEFYKIMPSAQAFQEIQMYLQGVLGNKEKEIVDISEKDKLL